MSKKILLPLILLLTGFVSFGQLYKKPVYPQGYFRWVTNLKPDIVANMGELRPNHWHMGLDVRTNQVVNQNVYAAADGYISFVGIEPLSWGRWIIITHPNGTSTLYGHLNDFRDDLERYVTEHQYETESWQTALTIPPGRFPVKKGDFISFSGTTGGSGGPHVHWEVIDTRSARRLNPTLFGTPIVDNIAPTIIKLAMYDRNNSVYDQTPVQYKLIKTGSTYSVAGGTINTSLDKLSFSIQAYDTRNGTGNQDGIYSARLFVDGIEKSSFYIDSIDYADSRYMNCQVDYKMVSTGGSWMQHTSKLPGDLSGVYYDLGPNNLVNLNDTILHTVRIDVADANGNQSTINFNIKNNGAVPPAAKPYEWQAGRPNRLSRASFEVNMPLNAIYDKMNTGYSSSPSASLNSVSARHKLGETYIPVHSNYEVRIKPDKYISPENKNKIVIKRVGKNTTVRKAVWNGEWLTAQFRDFGVFEAFIDNAPPSVNALGSGDVVNLNKAARISFTPTDNYGIADLRVEVDGKWLRFTNDKGRTWVYNFSDGKISAGQHELTVIVTDIAGNVTRRSWQFVRGVNPPAAATSGAANLAEEKPMPVKMKTVVNTKKTTAKAGATTSTTKKADTKSGTKSSSKASSKTAAKTSEKSSAKKSPGTTKSSTAKKESATKKSAPVRTGTGGRPAVGETTKKAATSSKATDKKATSKTSSSKKVTTTKKK
ncbi:peptidoglycan DD-metalloendopeptidase family protein [Niabella sp. CJ426]|uniref:peptidoglycan DD-metalloendopeptidase family protein n=1 Tax=Niabella sp. CJ426 TaxID=3393740 RepID=UPI003CFC3E26